MRVILADSDSATRSGWKADLIEIGVAEADIAEAPDLQTLFQTLTDGREVSLLIVPWVFSAMNGFTLLGEIKQRVSGAAPRVLTVGGSGDRKAMEACVQSGLASFVVKP